MCCFNSTLTIDAIHLFKLQLGLSPWPPRIYPDYFASTISVLIDDLKAAQRGTPEVPDPVPPALESFQDLNSGKGSDLFEFADLESAFRYVRKGHSLRIPEGWAHHVPKSI